MKPMNRTGVTRVAIAGLALGMAVLGCALPSRTRVGEVQTQTRSVDLGPAASAQVDIDFPAGELVVESGSGPLMEATFRYNIAEWQPRVDYSVLGSQGSLRVSQPGSEGFSVDDFSVGAMVNEWTIRLGEAIPLDLAIQVGAGQNTFDLGGLDLTRLAIDTGAGSSTIDLSGDWQHDVDASISSGVGDLTLILPAEMGVRVNADTGLVSVETSGLSQDADGYVNDAFGTAPYTFTLDLDVGVGSVTLRVP